MYVRINNDNFETVPNYKNTLFSLAMTNNNKIKLALNLLSGDVKNGN